MLADQRLGPVQFTAPLGQIDPGLIERRLGVRQARNRLIASGLVRERIDTGHHLIRRDLGIEIGMEALDHARHLTADLNRGDGIDRSRRRDQRDDGAPFDRNRAIAHNGLSLAVEEHIAGDGKAQRKDSDDDSDPTHGQAPSPSNNAVILAGNDFAMQYRDTRPGLAEQRRRRKHKGRLPVTANGLPNRSVRYERTFMTRLGTDRDAVLDIVEDVLRNHILGHQLTLHAVRAITHDPVGHILADTQRQNQIGRRRFVDIQQGHRRSRSLDRSAERSGR